MQVDPINSDRSNNNNNNKRSHRKERYDFAKINMGKSYFKNKACNRGKPNNFEDLTAQEASLKDQSQALT